MMKNIKDVIVVIPARYKSTRFPGKPLVNILNRPMIIWVAELCSKAVGISNVYIATEDERIKKVVEEYGFNCVITSPDHPTGTDRIAEVSTMIDAEIYVNVQGDEPILNYQDILKIVEEKRKYPEDIINAYCRISSNENADSVNIPKVLFTEDRRLVYMSRKTLPGYKDNDNLPKMFFKQVCIYAFNKKQLSEYKAFGRKSEIESYEDIEILRFLEFGETIRMVETTAGSLAVDIPDDVQLVEDEIQVRNGKGT